MMMTMTTMMTMMTTMVMVQSSWRDEGVIFEARGSCNVPRDLADKSPRHKITGKVIGELLSIGAADKTDKSDEYDKSDII